jgi:hypothetical protein
MSRLAEMLKSGIAPGLSGSMAHPDPQSVDVAVPRAIKEVFDVSYRHKRGQQPLRTEQVEKAIGYNAKTLRNTWKGLK